MYWDYSQNHMGKSMRQSQTEWECEGPAASASPPDRGGAAWTLRLQRPQLEQGDWTLTLPQHPVTGHGLPHAGSGTWAEAAPAEAGGPGREHLELPRRCSQLGAELVRPRREGLTDGAGDLGRAPHVPSVQWM